jgi:hypothetical protein
MAVRAVLAGLFVVASVAMAQFEQAQRCVVGGSVVDENGDPVQNALVRAEPSSPAQPPPGPATFTDDRGEFSLSLPPGIYYIAARSLGGLDDQPEIHTDGTSGAPYELTYYPSAPNKASAELVTAGSNSGALVIRLARQRTAPLPSSPPIDGKPASVGGVVFNDITGATLPRVHVSLRSFDDGILRSYGAMTTPDGKFSITGVPEGGYGIEARRVGFASPRPGGTSVTLHAGERDHDLRLPLTPAGAIVGRVLDAGGEPVDHAGVSARGKIGTAGSQADWKGRFRIGGLLPGSYRLEASPSGWAQHSKAPGPDGTGATESSTAYYPDAVQVRAGSDSGSFEVRLPRTPVVRVSGRVTGVPHGAMVSLSVNNRKGGFSDFLKADGTFEWWGLEPGRYVIRAWEGSGPSLLDGAPTPASAMATITVAGTNIDNLELRIRPPAAIPGSVDYETAVPQPRAGERSLYLTDLDRMADTAATVSGDGHFTLEHIPPGRYRVVCRCVSPAYVKSIRLGSSDIQGDILDMTDGSGGATLKVLVGSRFGDVSGSVQGERTAMAGLKVALVAVTPERDLPPRFSDIGASGRYSFDSVVPGKYRLAAVDENDLVIQGAAGLEQYEGVVEMVTVRAGEGAIANPRILRRQ